MYQSDVLKNHLSQSATIESRSVILAEWNLNIAENISKIGNYRYRPAATTDFPQKDIATWYDPLDTIQTNNALPKYNPAPGMYTGATDSDIVIDGGYDSDKQPIAFASEDVKKKILFSLEDCFNRFRPRSGINKMLFESTGFINDPSLFFAARPRYYMASKDDSFKYWTSFRKESSKNLGYAYQIQNDAKNYINDACPFVVYKHPVPSNRVVVKLQTNVGTETLPQDKLRDMNGRAITDPFFGDSNLTVPKEWDVEYLDSSNNWQTLKSFDGSSIVFEEDGYLELQYGLIIPTEYANFVKAPVINTTDFLPSTAPDGYAYLVIQNSDDKGTYYIRKASNTTAAIKGWDVWEPVYGWYVGNQTVDVKSSMVTNLTSPDSYVEGGVRKYREFSNIKGLRLVVKTMNKLDSRLELIELSPRLAADLSDITRSYSVTREAGDLTSSPLPIGSLVASTGSINLFDYNLAFSNYNKSSILNVVENNNIVYNISNKNIQIKFYEVIEGVEGSDYYVPIKTMYADGFPETNAQERSTTITLRDMFFYFESTKVTDSLVIDQPLSYVIATMLDSIGFTNYKFLRFVNEPDDIIPYFFISKDVNVAQILNELAIATQTAMYFDEANNFVVASRSYLFPDLGRRPTDFELNGSKDSARSGIVRNQNTNPVLANIKDVASKQENIYNSGKVVYSPKYIRKTVRNIQQASKLDKDRNWVYEPTLLWEVSETDSTKSVNGEASNPQGYALTAIPLKTDLNADVPKVIDVDGLPTMVNNVINFGDSVYFVGRYNGYFYANGEIIRYDAVEYSVPQSAYTGFGGTLNNLNKITITSGNVSNIKVGDRLYNVEEPLKIGAGAIVTAISGNVVTMSVPYTIPSGGTTSVTFTTTNTPNVWISSLEEYEKYFAKIPFNGKMYPTGRVRIYAEAPYDSSENLIIGEASVHGRGQFNTPIVSHNSGISSDWTSDIKGCYMDMATLLSGGSLAGGYRATGITAKSKNYADNAKVDGMMKNYLANSDLPETVSTDPIKSSKMVQSSALILNGPSFLPQDNPVDYISYTAKKLNDAYKHFGTRVRIVGQSSSDGARLQTPVGSAGWTTVDGKTVAGSSGGISVLLDPETNLGYYFEIAALTDNNVTNYTGNKVPINNAFFYKLRAGYNYIISSPFTTAHTSPDGDGIITSTNNSILDIDGTTEEKVGDIILFENQTDTSMNGFWKIVSLAAPWKLQKTEPKAVPETLWAGVASIITDSGQFAGMGRMVGESNPSVYDLAVEYKDVDTKTRKFYLYINDIIVGVVEDTDIVPNINNNHIGLFARGSARLMFENVYALMGNYSENAAAALNAPIADAFNEGSSVSKSSALTKYAVSGAIQSTYLQGIGTQDTPKYNMYYEEFGTIMREAAYFNIKYDKAYPALRAMIAPTLNSEKGYTISGFSGTPYGAEFLVFNNTDTVLALDETTGNYLRILGITFTQESSHDLTVDDYFEQKASLSNVDEIATTNLSLNKQVYQDIKNSRMTHGQKEFSLESPFIQSRDTAEKILEWVMGKVAKPRKAVGLNMFANPLVQIGDLAEIDYFDGEIDVLGTSGSQYMVYSIDYQKDSSGPSMTIHLSEVV